MNKKRMVLLLCAAALLLSACAASADDSRAQETGEAPIMLVDPALTERPAESAPNVPAEREIDPACAPSGEALIDAESFTLGPGADYERSFELPGGALLLLVECRTGSEGLAGGSLIVNLSHAGHNIPARFFTDAGERAWLYTGAAAGEWSLNITTDTGAEAEISVTARYCEE